MVQHTNSNNNKLKNAPNTQCSNSEMFYLSAAVPPEMQIQPWALISTG